MGKSKRQYYVWIGLDGYIIKHLTGLEASVKSRKGKRWVGHPTDTRKEAEELRQHIEQEQLRKLLEGYVKKQSGS